MPAQATGGRNGGGRGKYKQANKQLSESLREVCPPQKLSELDTLVKEYKGDEAKIREKISEWWEEPMQHPTEGEWEDVNKKGTIIKKKDNNLQPRGGRGDGRGRGRGSGREGRGGRGRSSDAGRGEIKKHEQKSSARSESHNGRSHGTPPVRSVQVPQGAWANKSEPSAPPVDPVLIPDAQTEDDEVAIPSVAAPVPVAPKPATPGPAGNVWATKGSAHLIEAEKPKPPPPIVQQPTPVAPPVARVAPVAPISRTTTKDPSPKLAPIQRSTPQSPAPELVTNIPAVSLVEQEHASVILPSQSSEPEPTLETGTSNAWTSGLASADTIESPSSPILNKTVGAGTISAPTPSMVSLPIPTVAEVPPPPAPAPVPKPVEAKLVPPTSFMNMGHWENEDNDDTNLDFGFGTFDAPSTNETTTSTVDVANSSPSIAPENSLTTSQPSAASASPARPPPGLSIGGGGMPPMPPNAVLVHELENKLEQVSIDANSKQPNSVPDKPTVSIQQQNHDFSAQIPSIQNPYGSGNQYGAMGVGYGYGGAAVNPFVGMPGPGAPVLSTPQQPPPTKPPQTSAPLSQPAGSSLYGTPHGQTTSTGPGSSVGTNTNDTAPPTSSGLPPAMPSSGMPYGNIYYGQQPPFHMGHNQSGIGYNYYGTQFGVQGFGYPQNLGQNTGYGHGPYHDETAGSHGHQAQGSTGGYQQQPKNNSGVYRGGRNNHSHHANNNQYQGYNPQQHLQGGYGAQPYGMGYHGDHFNQRGGYGGMQDPYSMQPQPPQGGGSYGFQSDDQYNKGKNKGTRGGGGGGLQNFQTPAGPPPHLSGQQGFGLQGQAGADSTQSNGGGWSNQHSSGWGTGTSGWQQK